MAPVRLTVRYLAAIDKWETVKPYQIAGRVTPGHSKDNIELDDNVVDIYDVKDLPEQPKLSTFGFKWIKRPFIESLKDTESINRRVRDLKELVKDRLGAKAMYTYQQQVCGAPRILGAHLADTRASS
jgi:hypothetical protein